MLLKSVLIFLVIVFSATVSAGSESPAKRKPKLSSMTGCVDEKPGRYVLVEDTNLKELVELEPVNFDKENFAKYLGHKVTVRGQMGLDADHAVMKVHSIQNISDTCAPAETQQ